MYILYYESGQGLSALKSQKAYTEGGFMLVIAHVREGVIQWRERQLGDMETEMERE